jgi:hypothetical protein
MVHGKLDTREARLRRSSAGTPGHRARRRRPSRGGVFAWLAFGLAVLVLASPLRLAWALPALGWTFPFFLWLGVIGLGAALGGGDDDGAGDDEDSA